MDIGTPFSELFLTLGVPLVSFCCACSKAYFSMIVWFEFGCVELERLRKHLACEGMQKLTFHRCPDLADFEVIF